MFEQIQEQYADEVKADRRWTVRRGWIGVALAWLVLVIRHYEK
jgi:hypothetical protein